MSEGPRVLVVSDDDDIGEPLAAILRHAGYRVGVRDGSTAVADLAGAPPEALILDRDLPPAVLREILARLEPHGGDASFPLLVLGGGSTATFPNGWHEDAARSVARPPQAGEILATLSSLRRLGFYRPYRQLVHDLSQPVMTVHALARSLRREAGAGTPSRETMDRLVEEAERLMILMEEFQRTRRAASG